MGLDESGSSTGFASLAHMANLAFNPPLASPERGSALSTGSTAVETLIFGVLAVWTQNGTTQRPE